MTTDKSKIVEKIRKLLALTESANENEAALAAQRAQELLAAHNIDLLEVEKSEEESEQVEQDTSETRSQAWRRTIYQAVAQMYFCEYYFMATQRQDPNSRRGYVNRELHFFTGKAHNVKVAKLMSAYLAATVIRLANEGQHQYPKSERVRYRRSFQNACASRLYWRIMDRIQETKAAATTTSDGRNLPALLNLYDAEKQANQSYLEQIGIKLRKSKSKRRSSHSGGYRDGDEAGGKISIDGQVSKDEQKARLQ